MCDVLNNLSVYQGCDFTVTLVGDHLNGGYRVVRCIGIAIADFSSEADQLAFEFHLLV